MVYGLVKSLVYCNFSLPLFSWSLFLSFLLSTSTSPPPHPASLPCLLAICSLLPSAAHLGWSEFLLPPSCPRLPAPEWTGTPPKEWLVWCVGGVCAVWWLTAWADGAALFRGEESAQWLDSRCFRVLQWESVRWWCVARRLDFEIWLGKHCAVLLALESAGMCERSVGWWWDWAGELWGCGNLGWGCGNAVLQKVGKCAVVLCGIGRVGSMGNRLWALVIRWWDMKALGRLRKYYIWWQ